MIPAYLPESLRIGTKQVDTNLRRVEICPMGSRFSSADYSGAFDAKAVSAIARKLHQDQGATSHAAFAFTSCDYLPFIDEFCDILRVEGRITNVTGCTGIGLVSGGQEREMGSGFSILSLSAPDTEFHFREISGDMLQAKEPSRFWRQHCGESSRAWIALINPYVFPADTWLGEWNAAFPAIPCVGGLASGKNQEEGVGVFLNGNIVEGGVVTGFSGGSLRMFPVVSQGCRPIGEPLTVTRAENNVIYALGAQPAYQALETAFQTLSENEKSSARGNLFAGLATSEYVEDFLPGDFLIRNIIGADPNSGAVVIGGIPRIGQTLQYQYRDREAATLDLTTSLQVASNRVDPPLGSLLFTCAGRGSRLFGEPNHDAIRFQEILGPHPCAGLLCNGEISPVHSLTSLTAYTASAALFYNATS